MKTSFLLPAGFAATLFLVPSLRAVDSDPAAPLPEENSLPSAASTARQAELLKRYDKNGDGKLDESEKAAAKMEAQKSDTGRKNSRQERALERYDKNGDGKLDQSERAAAMADLKNRPMVIKRFDKDGDGKLNAEEEAALEKAIRQRIERSLREKSTTSKAP